MQKQREFVADASHELRTPLTSVLANLELLQASLDGAGPGRRPRDRRLGPALLAADEPPGRRPAAAGPRRRRPRSEQHRRCDLAEIAGDAAAEAAPLMGERAAARRQRPAAAGRGQPRRAAPDGPQPARQRRPPHPAGLDDRARLRERGRRRRWSRSPTTAPASRPRCATRSSTASSAATARPTPPAAPAPASAWRSSAPWPPPTAAAVEVAESPAGGALFRVTHPPRRTAEQSKPIL